MSRARIIGIGAVLVGFVYLGATATDAHVGALMTIVRSALESQVEFEWIDHHSFIGLNGPGLAGIPAALAFLSLLFGGLPLAIVGLLLDQQWRSVPPGQRRHLPMPYVVLMFQIVSMMLSAFGLAMLGQALMWAISAGFDVSASDWLLPGYFGVQILASVAVIPAWRRHVVSRPLHPASLLSERVSRV
jgi:hypothetical protein